MERIFVGIKLNIDTTSLLQESIINAGRGVRWIQDENIHLTLKFIGDASSEQVRQVVEKLRIISQSPISLSFSGVGVLPKHGPPRVLYVAGEEVSELLALQQQVEDAMVELGFERNNKKFLNHVTVARVHKLSPKIAKDWVRCNAHYMSNVEISAFSLFRSHLSPLCAHYEEIETFPLVGSKGDSL